MFVIKVTLIESIPVFFPHPIQLALPLFFAAVSAGYIGAPLAYSAPAYGHAYGAPAYGHAYGAAYGHAAIAHAPLAAAAYHAPLAYHAPVVKAVAPLAYHAPVVKAVAPVATSYANTYKVCAGT